MKEQDLTPLEKALLAAVRAGKPFAPASFARAVPPDADDPAHDIRAAMLEALIDGAFGDPPIGRKGLFVAGARITGALDLTGATLTFPLFLRWCRFTHPLSLARARIPVLSLQESHIHGALTATQLAVDADLDLVALTAERAVCLEARIGGQLLMEGATLNAGEDGEAFDGQGLRAAQGAFLRGLKATGTVDLNGADIGGQLSMNGAVLTTGEDGVAFNGQGLCVAQGTFLHDLWATGTVALNSADIGDTLELQRARLRAAAGRDALRGDRLQVAGAVFLDDLDAEGTVHLGGARIGGFRVPGARFAAPGGDALVLEKASLGRADFAELSADCAGLCDLDDARIDTLILDPDPAAWPKGLALRCLDIRIDALPGYQRTAREGWIAWLDRQKPWAPHAYQQVAARLRAAGHEACAKDVYIAMRRRQRAAEHEAFLKMIPKPQRDQRLNGYFPERLVEWIARKFDAWMLEGVIGYGYRPMRAVGVMAGLILLGIVIFQQAWDARLMAPAQATIFEAIPPDAARKGEWGPGFRVCAQNHPPESTALVLRSQAEENCLPKDYPSFIPLYYSFDLAIPLLEMRPEKFWTVNSSAPWGWLVLIWYYCQIVAGAVLTGLFLAAVTGIVKKE